MIVVNGERCELAGGVTVKQVLQNRNFVFPMLIVKINGEYVPRDQYEHKTVPEGATVDVIHLISGG